MHYLIVLFAWSDRLIHGLPPVGRTRITSCHLTISCILAILVKIDCPASKLHENAARNCSRNYCVRASVRVHWMVVYDIPVHRIQMDRRSTINSTVDSSFV